MIKVLMLTAALLFGAASIPAMAQECNSVEAVKVLLETQKAVDGIYLTIDDPVLVDNFKNAVVEEFNIEKETLLFSKIVVFNIDFDNPANESFKGQYWITLYDENGCLMQGFAENMEAFDARMEVAKGLLIKD